VGAPKLGRPPKYNWEQWIDNKEHILRRGKDFATPVESFATLCRARARALDIGIKIHRHQDSVHVTFIGGQLPGPWKILHAGDQVDTVGSYKSANAFISGRDDRAELEAEAPGGYKYFWNGTFLEPSF